MAPPTRIFATGPIPEIGLELLGSLGDVVVADLAEPGAIADAEILIVRSTAIDGAVLDRAPRLRALARTGVGLDKVDVEAASARGVAVLFAPDAGSRPVAEGAIALIIAATKRLGELGELVTTGRWEERYSFQVRDLDGSTLGIVGLGRIGSEVGRLAVALGMDVIYHDPRGASVGERFPDARAVGLKELFREADVISLHCSLDEGTRGMIDRELLADVRPGAILVNASRGGLLADPSLLGEALERGWLSAVGLDVYSHEPPDPADPLLNDPRVICTPHSIGLTRRWNERVFESLRGDLEALLSGGRPDNIANPDVLPGLIPIADA